MPPLAAFLRRFAIFFSSAVINGSFLFSLLLFCPLLIVVTPAGVTSSKAGLTKIVNYRSRYLWYCMVVAYSETSSYLKVADEGSGRSNE